jgi:glycosyltransferase involved in cell wall biosynthesis
VQRQHSGVKLLIVGSGPMRQSLEDTARHLGIFADTHFEPATADVMRWMNTMDIFVLPSLSEALSNSLMEAMACGVAPVASNVGGNPELVSDGETGLLFRPGNADDLAAALNRLVTSETFHHDLAARALAFIRSNLTICRAAERMSEVYRELLPRAR